MGNLSDILNFKFNGTCGFRLKPPQPDTLLVTKDSVRLTHINKYQAATDVGQFSMSSFLI